MNKIEAGTKIIITTPWAGETEYKTGDIFTVELPSPPGVYVLINGVSEYIASDEFEVYTEPEYKVGDRVQITIPDGDTDTFGGWFFVTGAGTVQEPAYGGTSTDNILRVLPDVTHPRNGNDEAWNIDKKYVTPLAEEPEPEPLAEWEKELLNVFPRNIAFEDIQEGDLIKAEYTEDGVKHVAEGVAGYHYDSTGNWVTSRTGGYVAKSKWGAAYTLLERPEPTPNPFAEANVGSLAWENDSYTWYKTADNEWKYLRHVEPAVLSIAGYTDERMNDGSFQITYNA